MDKLVLTNGNWNPSVDKVYARSTPDTAIASIGGHYNTLGGANRHYLWGTMGWMTNGGTAPLTNSSQVSQGYRVRSLDATTRQVGADGDAHAVEIISGQWDAKARLRFTKGSNRAEFIEEAFKGSRYCIGDEVTSHTSYLNQSTKIQSIVLEDGLEYSGKEVSTVSVISKGSGYKKGESVWITGPATHTESEGTVLEITPSGGIVKILITNGGSHSSAKPMLEVFGGSGEGATVSATYITLGTGLPKEIILSQPALKSGIKKVSFKSSVDNNNIGLLISGSGDGGTDGKGNKNGKAIVVQAYGEASYDVGLQFSGSAIRPEGHGHLFNFADCTDYIKIGSSVFSDSILNINNTKTNTIIDATQVKARHAFRLDSTNKFTDGAIYLDGHAITTGLEGFKVGDSENDKVGFWGMEPAKQQQTPIVPENATVEELTLVLKDLINKLSNIGILGNG